MIIYDLYLCVCYLVSVCVCECIRERYKSDGSYIEALSFFSWFEFNSLNKCRLHFLNCKAHTLECHGHHKEEEKKISVSAFRRFVFESVFTFLSLFNFLF